MNELAVLGILAIIAFAAILALSISPGNGPIACTMEAKMCPDGSYVGRNAQNNCEFDPCPDGGTMCDHVAARGEFCAQIYQPVCGWFGAQIQCFRYPCASTYSNACEACKDEKVSYWTSGQCPK